MSLTPSLAWRTRRGATVLDAPDALQPEHASSARPLVLQGVAYFRAADVARAAGISRQTLWRWRQQGKAPAGRKYRDNQVLFTAGEMSRICEYAQRLEPIDLSVLGETIAPCVVQKGSVNR